MEYFGTQASSRRENYTAFTYAFSDTTWQSWTENTDNRQKERTTVLWPFLLLLLLLAFYAIKTQLVNQAIAASSAE